MFDLDLKKVKSNLSLNSIRNWDSLKQMELIFFIEKKIKKELKTGEIEKVKTENWNAWLTRYLSSVSPDRRNTMDLVNPKYVLRNWMAQLAIDKAEKGDFSLVNQLHELLKRPYDEQHEMEEAWFVKRPEWARNRVGCSMLSCSS